MGFCQHLLMLPCMPNFASSLQLLRLLYVWDPVLPPNQTGHSGSPEARSSKAPSPKPQLQSLFYKCPKESCKQRNFKLATFKAKILKFKALYKPQSQL